MKANIPGAKEGMYMATDSSTVEVRPIDIHGDYTMEARGLWRIKGDFMGTRLFRTPVWIKPATVLSLQKYLFTHPIK